MVWSESADVVVVGGGSAAHEAAVAAKHYGAGRVILLEKAPKDQAGGNARFSGTGFRWAFDDPQEIREVTGATPEEFAPYVVEPYTEQRFRDDLNHVSQGLMDPELVDVLVGDSNAAIRWAREVGLEWQLQTGYEQADGTRFLFPGGEIHPRNPGTGMTNGLSQLMQWAGIADRLGVETRYDAKVVGFLGDETGIEGVKVSGLDGAYEIHAKAVIVAAGGFQANPAMRARYLGPNADLMKVRGSRHNTGEVLEALLRLGALPGGHWQRGHATPIDESASRVESGDDVNRYLYPWGVGLNVRGERFFDEGEAASGYTYAKTGWKVQEQPEGRAFWFGTQDQWELNRQFPLWHRPDTAIWADTIEELAERVGLDPKVVRATIDVFNAAIDTSIPFERNHQDGRRTRGLNPDKTNWAQALDHGPYYVVSVTGGLTFTFGGLTINGDAQVIAIGGRTIPGLYATGDILGIFFHNYPAMTGQTRNLVFARRAGQHAARHIAGTPA